MLLECAIECFINESFLTATIDPSVPLSKFGQNWVDFDGKSLDINSDLAFDVYW